MTEDIPEVARSIDSLRKFMGDFANALNALVDGVSATAPNEVRACLPVYSQIIPVFDERLARCADLLRRGLRDEAVGYEADTPALIDAVTLLDLASKPQWEAWKSALDANDFPLPPLPRMDLAAVLVEARNTLADLKPLLDRWRRLNLSNAPLPERLRMLRKLRQKDPNNEVWFESILEHEKQRLMEIERDIKAAITAKDETALTALLDELTDDWTEKPPERLKAAATSALENFKSSRLDRQMAEVGRNLAAAFESRDLDAGRQLRRQWAALMEEKGPDGAGDPLVATVDPAIAWVDRHDRLEALSTEIPQALDTEPSGFQARRQWVRSLERMGQELEDLTEKLHDEVEIEPIERNLERIARVVEAFNRWEIFRRRLMFASVAATALLVAGLVYDRQRRVAHEQRVRDAIAAIEKCEQRITRGNIEDLDAMVQPWLPAVSADPRVSGKLATARAEDDKQTARRKRLDDNIERIERSLQDVEAARQARQDPLQPWPVEFAKATRDLATTKADAVTEAEKTRLQTKQNDVDIAKTKFHAKADVYVSDAVREINERLVELRDLVTKDRAALIKGVGEQRERFLDLRRRATAQAAPEAEGEYANLKTASGKARPLVAEDGVVAKQLEELTSLAAKWDGFEKALAGLDGKLGDWPEYAAQLRAIANGFPDIAESRDYGTCADAAAMWDVAAAWNRLSGEIGDIRVAADAQKLLAGLDALGKAAGQYRPAADFRKRYGELLQAQAKQNPANVKAKIEKFLDSAWLADIRWVVAAADGRFYCTEEPQSGDFFKYVVGWKGERNDGQWPLKQSTAPAEKVTPAPSVALRDAIRTAIGKGLPNGPQCDEVMVKILETAIKSEQVDPILRAVTARQVFVAALEECRALQCPAAAALVSSLKDAQNQGTVPGIPKDYLTLWVKPDRESLRDYVIAKPKASDFLGQVQDVIPAIRQAIAADKGMLASPSGERMVLVGRMGRDAAGRGFAVTRGKVTAGELVTIDVDGAINPAGTIDASGRFTPASPPPPAGSPLWRRDRFGAAAKTSPPGKPERQENRRP